MFIKYRGDIKKALLKFLEKKKQSHGKVNNHALPAIKLLQSVVADGKLLRGSLVLWSYEAFAKELNRKKYLEALSCAVALELFHNSLLIHDDVMDGDLLRRGRPSIFGDYWSQGKRLKASDPKHYGESMAVCVGDLGYFWAMEVLGQCESTSFVGSELASVAIAQMHDVHCGEVGSEEPSEVEILNLYRYKTARYTFVLPMTAGAKIAGADKKTLRLLEIIGENLGTAFQLKDDELGLFGTEDQTGKPVGSDIRSNKKTLFRKMLFGRVSNKDLKILKHHFGSRSLSERGVKLVRNISEKYYLKDDIISIIEKRSVAAKGDLDKLNTKIQSKQQIFELIDFMTARQE
jgi:geranylgeranyl diphosphate synthase, type I